MLDDEILGLEHHLAELRAQRDATYGASAMARLARNLVRALDHNPSDPEVREKMRLAVLAATSDTTRPPEDELFAALLAKQAEAVTACHRARVDARLIEDVDRLVGLAVDAISSILRCPRPFFSEGEPEAPAAALLDALWDAALSPAIYAAVLEIVREAV